MASMNDQVIDAAKATPPLLVTGASLAGLSLSDWAYVLTIIYTACMITDWVIKKIRLWRARRRDDPTDRAGA